MESERLLARDVPPRLERSPHPYHRNSLSQASHTPHELLVSGWTASASQLQPQAAPSSSNGAPVASEASRSWDCKVHSSRPSSPSESGTEADDEAGMLARALPAPPYRPRKGLRDAPEDVAEEATTGAMSLGQVDPGVLFAPLKAKKGSTQKLFRQTRAAELLRRACEVVALALIGVVVNRRRMQSSPPPVESTVWPQESSFHLLLLPAVCFLHLLRLLALPYARDGSLRLGKVIIPSSFDPAPILYPTLLPLLVSVSMTGDRVVVLANSMLGVASIPAQLIPHLGASYDFNATHWLLSLIPAFAMAGGATEQPSKHQLDELSMLFPLFTTLIPALHFLTTSSLLRSELRLLAVSLINLLIFSRSPQIRILTYILWIGGIGLFVSCMHILRWNVALERIPRWRLQRAVGLIKAGNAFLAALSASLRPPPSFKDGAGVDLVPLEEEEEAVDASDLVDSPRNGSLKQGHHEHRINGHWNGGVSTSAADTRRRPSGRPFMESGTPTEPATPRPRRSSTFSATEESPARGPKGRRRRGSSLSQIYLSMTPRQAELTKWLYAVYFFAVLIVLVLGPIRYFVALRALDNQEPFGWAIGYLFRDIPAVRSLVLDYDLEHWIVLTPPYAEPMGWVDRVRHTVIGTSNTRLVLFMYWLAVIALGILIVLILSTAVEVDTRRKIFHGTMVVMLLPTAFIDPCLLALALALVLAIFLLLDLIRASQLRPLSRPLALFLTPYVDGRDLRGPVVVSHIFLLIGCAIPFWLSLAAIPRTGSGPWTGWDIASRDVSMVAGVICVGMGDAAASLVGRRVGRHKWPWSGGKSLEGSAAFALAVTIGLLASKWWSVYGGWQQTWDGVLGWRGTLRKSLVAGVGASFTEAVLTGCNDNVVVPVILWCLVRGLAI